ncbi:MAG: acyl-ACP--UDP-N-acetylglucosamine O-acyltransferase [Planctomycetes bacterium]|nr:acyl-ACP--UDP-N-acetylglucosamine O-acyltransferase [Planctomycetota bacterium]
MSEIHPLAFVDPRAELADDVRIGPFCQVGRDVMLGPGCVLHGQITILGPSQIGARNVFHQGCVIGAAPQDLKYKGGPTRLVVGDDNIFREQVTVHRGTEVDRQSNGTTCVGNHNLFMVGVHIAHDTVVHNHVILANAVQVAGHVSIEDYVNVGGASAMHHFVTVGRNAFVAGMTRITHDVPPYVKVLGYDAAVRGVNVEGMRRWHIADESIDAVKEAFRLLYARRTERSPGQTLAALREIERDGLLDDQHVRYLVEFLRRKLEIGVFGRVRERYRGDVPEDRAGFYRAGEKEPA